MGFGTTVVGASNVLTLSTRGPVSVSPAADRSVMPATLAVDRRGPVGIDVGDCHPHLARGVPGRDGIYARQGDRPHGCSVPASKVTGTNVASWNGTYIWKTW